MKSKNKNNNNRKHYRARRMRLDPERENRILRLRLKRLKKLSKTDYQADQSENQDLNKLKRHCAALQNDLDAIRRRQKREREQHKKFAAQPVVEALLPALDAINHALTSLEEDQNPQALADGMKGIHQLIEKALSQHGLERYNPEGETFDPNLHEAISVLPSPDHEPGTVMAVIQQGYKLNERVIRPARVCIAQKP